MSNRIVEGLEASYLGKVDYLKAVELQENILSLVKDKNVKAIIGVEHPAVMTYGRRVDPTTPSACDFPKVKSTRGGLVTIHSEGQLVIYPLLDLRTLRWGVKQYVCKLLRATQMLLQDLNVESFIDDKTVGLYTANGKIAFCGIQVKNGISLHGISLNVRNDLDLFQAIAACGVKNAPLDRLQNHHVDRSLEELFKAWVQIFRAEFHQTGAP